MPAVQRDAADGGLHRDAVGADPRDLQRRQLDCQLAIPAGGNPEIAQTQSAIGQLEHPGPASELRLVMPVDGELSRRDIGI